MVRRGRPGKGSLSAAAGLRKWARRRACSTSPRAWRCNQRAREALGAAARDERPSPWCGGAGWACSPAATKCCGTVRSSATALQGRVRRVRRFKILSFSRKDGVQLSPLQI